MNTPISSVLKRKGYSVHSVPPHLSVLDAVREMNKHGIGCVLVMDGAQLVGIFTERDVLTRVIAAEVSPSALTVSQVMTPNPHTTTADATVQQVMDIFHNRRCRHLPVMQDGKVQGMISIRDISRWLADAHRAEAEQLRQYISGGFSA
jgi:CBS domain-containing protein